MSTDVSDSLDSLSPAQRQVLVALKRAGEASADELAAALGITASGVRQHLAALRSAGIVECRQERGRPGRPVDLYYGTELAEVMVPKTSGALILELLEVIEDEDPELLLRLFQQRQRRRVKEVQDQLRGKDLPDRVAGLAKILDDEGYLSGFEELADDTFQIILHNCAIWGVASRYPQACSSELDFLREVLTEANVERINHKIAGAHVCGYQIELTNTNLNSHR